MAEIITCPACQRQLQVPVSFYGQTVQCPQCAQNFVAEPPAESVQPAPAVPKTTAPPPEDRPHRRKRAYNRDHDDDYDDEFDDLGPRRRSEMPHRGGLILALGIMALVGGMMIGLPYFLGPVAWIMGNSDLAEIQEGRMDPSGEGMVQAGRVLGMISTFFLLLSVLLLCGFFGLIFWSVGH